jgi:hypothetical protein
MDTLIGIPIAVSRPTICRERSYRWLLIRQCSYGFFILENLGPIGDKARYLVKQDLYFIGLRTEDGDRNFDHVVPKMRDEGGTHP